MARSRDISKVLSQNNFLYRETIYFTSSGTFSKASYPWLRAVKVKMVGGGGGGSDAQTSGSSQVSVGGGGGGGAYCEKFYTDIASLASSITVTVGTGGTPGNSGGTSSFVSMSANGGATGNAMGVGNLSFYYSNPGLGGTASGGDLNIDGFAGIPGEAWAYDRVQCSTGGETLLSGRTIQGVNTTGTTGANGVLYGGGGSSAANGQNQSARAGGTGAAGIVILELYA